jgi:molecular chaperone GrpE (heat shock protein)
MEVEQIIAELEAQRDAIDRAIALLRGDARPAAYRMKSIATRRKMSEGMKKHWIERRKKIAQKAA